MDKALILSLVSAAIMMFGHIVYIKAIINRETLPNKATWFVISFTAYIFIANQIASEINNSIWGMALPLLTITTIAALTMKYGESSINKVDVAAVLISIAGITAWWLLENPRASIVASSLTGIVSIVPTLNKLRQQPGSENTITWALAAISMVFILFAVEPEFDFLLVPATWLILNLTVAIMNALGTRQMQLNSTAN